MAIEETFRREFQTRVEEALDAESARFLMAHLPPVPWPEVATTHDLGVLRADIEVLRTDIDGRFEVLRAAIDGRFSAMEQRMENRFLTLQTELSAGLTSQRADLMLLITNQTRTMIIALITAFVAISSVALFR